MPNDLTKQCYQVHGATTMGKSKCVSCGKELPDGRLRIHLTLNIQGEIRTGHHCTVCAEELDKNLTLI